MMKPLLTCLLFILGLSTTITAQGDSMDVLYGHFKTGNYREIGKNFAANVEIILIDEEDVYSKAQAEQILRDFFIKNPPQSFSKVHSVGNTNVKYRFGVIVLATKNGKYRVSTLMNRTGNSFLISELRIEPEK